MERSTWARRRRRPRQRDHQPKVGSASGSAACTRIAWATCIRLHRSRVLQRADTQTLAFVPGCEHRGDRSPGACIGRPGGPGFGGQGAPACGCGSPGVGPGRARASSASRAREVSGETTESAGRGNSAASSRSATRVEGSSGRARFRSYAPGRSRSLCRSMRRPSVWLGGVGRRAEAVRRCRAGVSPL
ncbi:MAG: hypothetical protein QOI71_2178 [Gaiellales bacterium]|nr:hypothetical protein [Gaiellales bacterium]